MKKYLLKKIFFFLALAIAAMSANATVYALYGDVPEGATDLTSVVVAEPQGTITFVEGVLTGAGLPGRTLQPHRWI